MNDTNADRASGLDLDDVSENAEAKRRARECIYAQAPERALN
ncbi:MAG: hypothetical protein NW206_00915 [Hyphomonadaceae bacterium]|nr:hypothetical protein [Hyphomonadaceae bacterium]